MIKSLNITELDILESLIKRIDKVITRIENSDYSFALSSDIGVLFFCMEILNPHLENLILKRHPKSRLDDVCKFVKEHQAQGYHGDDSPPYHLVAQQLRTMNLLKQVYTALREKSIVDAAQNWLECKRKDEMGDSEREQRAEAEQDYSH